MASPHERNITAAFFFLALLIACIVADFHYSSAETIRRLLTAPLGGSPFGSMSFRLPGSTCPRTAYEYETIRLVLTVPATSTVPAKFIVETPKEIEVQGSKERVVQGSETWFLVPTQQGEYTVVVRGLGEVSFRDEHGISVRRFDNLTRRSFNFVLAVGAFVGFIGTVVSLIRGGKEKQPTSPRSTEPSPAAKPSETNGPR